MAHSPPATTPDWDALYATAQTQSGHVTTRQAAASGYSPQLLHKYLDNGKIERVRRGIYRLIHFPPVDDEDLVVLWLWSDRAGVFSHQTALALRDLADVLPSKVHMTVPSGWEDRRLRVPEGLVLHYADLGSTERTEHDAVPVTSVQRTLLDCIELPISPDLVDRALAQARSRGLLSGEAVHEIEARRSAREKTDR